MSEEEAAHLAAIETQFRMFLEGYNAHYGLLYNALSSQQYEALPALWANVCGILHASICTYLYVCIWMSG
jgi:hypothetical protein